AAHERRLALELSSGGMESLAALRDDVKRLDHDGSGFSTEKQIFEALREAGYALDMESVGVLKTGLGIDAGGSVDLAEFMGMCEDIASNQEWYMPPQPSLHTEEAGDTLTSGHNFTSAKGGRGAFAIMTLPFPWLTAQASNPLHGQGGVFGTGGEVLSGSHMFDGRTGPRESHFLGGTVFGEKKFLEGSSPSIKDVLGELKDQLSLLDVDHLRGGGASSPEDSDGLDNVVPVLGKAVNGKFLRRDLQLTGVLSARELGLALEDIGVTLQPSEVITLAAKFRPPGDRNAPFPDRAGGIAPNIEGLDDTFAEYAPLVR
ncbi:unnamed protein product, partial [Sphacelaria rigidula]